ncbi:MAG: HAMP domain-containing sensor histidine kinase [Vicinamibacterales bacterium]
MPSRHFDATIHHFATRLAAEHAALARVWLERLDALLDVERGEVFPTHQLLDHIPDLLREIAGYLQAPAEQEIAANTAVMAKAAELGLLRFNQRASVHQLLREYQLLSEILDGFFAREAALLDEQADATAAVLAVARAQRAVRELQRKTVDAFIGRFTETIEQQHSQLAGFGHLVIHEIRQPLGVLQVLTRLLESATESERPRLVETLARNVGRLGDVTGKLERLARLTSAAENAPNEQTVDVAAICLDVVRQIEEMAGARGVSFEIAEDLPRLSVDAGRLELVLMNLLANAVKYSDPAKSPRLVRIAAGAGGDGITSIQVSDNGVGIPAAKRALIFEQFVRAHAHRDAELGAQGLGLGLSIVRDSMEAMEGTVTVESVEGEGTTFVLAWTVEAPPPSVVGPDSPPEGHP